jgi:hypothetical protein
VVPSTVWSSVKTREKPWMTVSMRSTSLMAFSIRSGWSRSSVHWSGCRAKSQIMLAVAKIVVSRLGPM